MVFEIHLTTLLGSEKCYYLKSKTSFIQVFISNACNVIRNISNKPWEISTRFSLIIMKNKILF